MPVKPPAPDLRAIGWPEEAWTREWEALAAAGRVGRVVGQHRTAYDVARGPADSRRVRAPAEWARPGCDPEARACVGDWVELDEAAGEIVALLPRRSLLKRAAAGEHYRTQPIAANLDVALVVCGLDGDFNPRRIERYLALIAGSGVAPVVVLTKRDLCPDVEAASARLEAVRAAGVDLHAVNAKDPASVAVLQRYLGPGRTGVLVGSSGAGKSTLTNTLLGTEKLKTAAVRAGDSRGRHTTTRRVLLPLPQGGCLIDTPGMRELKLTGAEDLDESFEDIAALASQCRFRDCRHRREPGCALRAAVAAGRLDGGRLEHYLRLREEAGQAGERLAARLARKAGDRVQNKALNQRLEDKYGRR